MAFLLHACATGSAVQVADVKVISATAATSCEYIDTVYGTSSWYGVFAERGIENARYSVFSKAKGVGATHIAWEPIPQSHGSSQVTGRAYKCRE
jgi:hypothetical protein